MDYTMIRNVVNRALEQMAAREMTGTDNLSAEQEIAMIVVSDLFPTLREAFAKMVSVNETWLANGISDKIAAAAANEENLAGYPPEVWMLWGLLLPHTLGLLAAIFQVPLADGTVREETLKSVVMKRYIKEE